MPPFEFKLSAYPLYGVISGKINNVHGFDHTWENMALQEKYYNKKFELFENRYIEMAKNDKEIRLNDIFGIHFKEIDIKEQHLKNLKYDLDFTLQIHYMDEKGIIDFNELINEKMNIIYDSVENEILNIKVLFIQFLIDDINKYFGVTTLRTIKYYTYLNNDGQNYSLKKIYKRHLKNIKRLVIGDLKEYLFEILSTKKEVVNVRTFISLLFELDILDKKGLDYKEMEKKAIEIIEDRNHKIFDHIEIRKFTGDTTIYDTIKTYRGNNLLFTAAVKKAKSLINEFELNRE